MRHAPDGVLRRLEDEPLAISDTTISHVAGCVRCRARQAQIARHAEESTRWLSSPQLVPSTDAAWTRFQEELDTHRDGPERAMPPRQRRVVRVSLRTAVGAGTVVVVAAALTATATLTSVFTPTHVARAPVNANDIQAIAAFTGLGGSHVLGGFPTPSGSGTLPFGTIQWSSSGMPSSANSAADAAAQAGIGVPLPARLPSGVAPAAQFEVQPQVSTTLTFNAAAGSLAGSSVALRAGPAVLATYGSSSLTGLPTLGVLTMPRPAADSTGAAIGQIEAYLLTQSGLPAQFGQILHLLGDLGATPTAPAPSGTTIRSVQIGGQPGVVIADASNAAAGVIWVDSHGLLHVVGGILSQQSVVSVANQLH